jgi:hypothetical protein
MRNAVRKGLAQVRIQIYLALYTDSRRANMAKLKRTGRKAITPEIRRKNVNIDQAKLDRVRELLGSSSETEAIDQALEMLLFREELLAGVASLAGKGGVADAYSHDLEL